MCGKEVEECLKIDSVTDLRKKTLRGKSVSFKGIISSKGDVYPQINKIRFRCINCGRSYEIKQKVNMDKTKAIKYPSSCKCGSETFDELDEEYIDTQIIKIIDSNIFPNSKPLETNLFLIGDLAGNKECSPYVGDLVEVKGILQINRRYKNPYFINAKSIKKLIKGYDNLNITEDDKKKIKELGEDPKILDRIIKSFVPSIRGCRDIKEAIILQLFADETSPSSKLIHILIISEDNPEKRMILKNASSLSPVGLFIDGKDPEIPIISRYSADRSGGKSLKAGALILGDKGVLYIDNIDSLGSDQDFIKFTMESQKSNVIGVKRLLDTKIAITAGLTCDKINQRRFIKEQIHINHPLFYQFDLVYVIQNQSNKLPLTNISGLQNEGKKLINNFLFKKYVTYARNIQPKLNDDVLSCLNSFYSDLRDKFGNYLMNPNKLKGIYELTKANARLHLRDEVIIEDAEKAIKLYKNSLKHLGVDPDKE